ncbi:hypothetical protein N7540_009909 [Penicillium herquei]|nr:hypothetical protein N7540_009909 [Penicillium herquei]
MAYTQKRLDEVKKLFPPPPPFDPNAPPSEEVIKKAQEPPPRYNLRKRTKEQKDGFYMVWSDDEKDEDYIP